MSVKRIGILRGGPSPEYDVSLKTGASIFRHCPRGYAPVDILISKDGEWHADGLPTIPARILPHLDSVFNALHGAYGEDGTVQKILEHYHVPYTGSGAVSSAIGMNKFIARKMFKDNGLKVPYSELIDKNDFSDNASATQHLFQKFSFPFVLKPIRGGSSIGVVIARRFEDISKALDVVYEHGDKILIEEYIRGREATCGVVDNFRDSPTYALMPIEIIKPSTSSFFDYQAKYSGKTEELCPSPHLSAHEKRAIEEAAVIAHKAIGARHYSRSDFIVSPRGVYILEINTLPGLTEESLLPKSIVACGATLSEFLEHVIEQSFL